jgi:hypothetical protein
MPQPHRSSACTWRPTSSPPPPAHGATGLDMHLPPHADPSVILGSVKLPPGAMGSHDTPAVAHNALKPAKGKPQALCRRPRVNAPICRARGSRQNHSAEARLCLVCAGEGRVVRVRERGAPRRCQGRQRAHHTRFHTPMGMEAEGQGSSKTTGWAGHSPLRATRRVGAEREDPAARAACRGQGW